MGEVKPWNHFSRFYETMRYESSMCMCTLKSQGLPFGLSDLFFLWRRSRSFSFSGRWWFSSLQQLLLWPYPDVGALPMAERFTLGMRNMLFNRMRAEQIALCFTSVLLMHYHCPSTIKKRKVWANISRPSCLVSLLGCLHLANSTTCLCCAVLGDRLSCSHGHSWGKFVILYLLHSFHQMSLFPLLMATGQWSSFTCSKGVDSLFFPLLVFFGRL